MAATMIDKATQHSWNGNADWLLNRYTAAMIVRIRARGLFHERLRASEAGPGIHSIGYFAFTLEVMEVITLDAILN